MDDKAKATMEQGKLDEIEVKANSVYETRPVHHVDGGVEECSHSDANYYGIYIRPRSGGPGMWVADVATKDDADFICKCLQARYK